MITSGPAADSGDEAAGIEPIPAAWIEELAAVLASEPADAGPVPLRLTYPPHLPDLLSGKGTSLSEVAADISAGCVMKRRAGTDGEFFALYGERFTVFVNPRQGRDSGAPMAVASSVRPEPLLQRRDGLLGYDVAFYELNDEAECDIAAICVKARQRLAADRTRHAKAMRAAERGLARPPALTADASHAGLHAEARQRYATLLNVFTLLRQRGDIQGGALATGVVAADTGGLTLAMRILLPPDPQPGSPTSRFPDTGPVLVQVPGRDQLLRLDLLHVYPEYMEIAAPDPAIPAGTEVTVEYQPRFQARTRDQTERAERQRQDELSRAAERALAARAGEPGTLPDDERLHARIRSLVARVGRLGQYIALERRWFELIEGATAAGDDLRKVGEMLVNTANLVCGTTTGFGGKIVENADFDTLIVDEASRVVDSEFLIGAVRARRWILVGDEHQLPPYVDQIDEHHLHALAALHPAGSPGSGPPRTLAAAVDHLGQLWAEDEELHQPRRGPRSRGGAQPTIARPRSARTRPESRSRRC